MQAITNDKPEVSQSNIVDFGDGPFSKLMENYFGLSQKLLKLSEAKAEKYARQLASDLGAIHKNLKFDVTAGKPNKDMLRKVGMAGKSGLMVVPPSVNVLIALQWMEDAGKNNVSYGHTTWKLVPSLNDWLNEL
jgi:hypothetical protein